MLQTYVRIHCGVKGPERKEWREQRRWRKMNQNIPCMKIKSEWWSAVFTKILSIIPIVVCIFSSLTIMIYKWLISILTQYLGKILNSLTTAGSVEFTSVSQSHCGSAVCRDNTGSENLGCFRITCLVYPENHTIIRNHDVVFLKRFLYVTMMVSAGLYLSCWMRSSPSLITLTVTCSVVCCCWPKRLIRSCTASTDSA